MKNLFLILLSSLLICSLSKAEFLNLPDCDSDLLAAARTNSYDIAKNLLEKGTNPNCFGATKMTPLQWVLFPSTFSDYYKNEDERISFARLLLNYQAGLSINSQDKNKDTALTRATNYTAPKLVKFLLDNGADPNLLGSMDLGPLHRAAMLLNDASVIDILIQGGADINLQGGDWQSTPVILATGYEMNPAKLRRLIDAKANLEIADKFGRTPIIIASQGTRHRASEYLTLLLDAGANVNARDLNGGTALIYATQKGDKEAVDVLLKHGAHR